MNHVVEGILATYSPYYIPGPLEIYFLEDFWGLRQTLPRVRPAIFFSVPRYYEKVWEAFQGSRPGRIFLGAREGWFKRLLRRFVRRGLLRTAGLDRCNQLIVGSAPCGEDLLRAFQGLGIEVHNAYGMTEAPLVTMNRLGANRVGTVGEPLPRTEVRVAEDGEVMVRGPQVTGGYFGEGVEPPFRGGWLLTGDLGYLSEEGSLVLHGRKKELIVTSYGKNVHPLKVEGMLRGIPGIVEAMLVGDCRPYCVALLWVEGDVPDGASADALDRAVLEVNRRLSQPEQVKSWAVLAHDLSIDGGDLTANLKLKREAVAGRLDAVIKALYDRGTMPGDVLHRGGLGRDEM
jgi:long-chain acyl-CoA synthetase